GRVAASLNSSFCLGEGHIRAGGAEGDRAIRVSYTGHVAKHFFAVGHGEQIDMIPWEAETAGRLALADQGIDIVRIELEEPVHIDSSHAKHHCGRLHDSLLADGSGAVYAVHNFRIARSIHDHSWRNCDEPLHGADQECFDAALFIRISTYEIGVKRGSC